MPEIEAIVGWDHKRYYGYDFSDKLEKFGFQVEIFRITKAEANASWHWIWRYQR